MVRQKFLKDGSTYFIDELNKYHRTDGPAIERVGGYKAWYQHGKRHRTDGPAIDSAKFKAWYKYGELHRTDGPAIEHSNGNKAWYQYGQHIKTCIPKTITIQESGIEKQISICCIECVRCYKHISEEKFYKLSLLL